MGHSCGVATAGDGRIEQRDNRKTSLVSPNFEIVVGDADVGIKAKR